MAAGTGGAIYLDLGTKASIEDCLFSQNRAETLPPDIWGGGAIAGANNIDLVIKNTDIVANMAERGGGVWLGANAVVEIRNTRFVGNTVHNYDGVSGGWHVGGGFGAYANCRLQVIQSLFDGNVIPEIGAASDAGGAIFGNLGAQFSIVNSTIINNEAADYGGGICMRGYYQSVSITIDNSILVGNTSQNSTDGLYDQVEIWGDGTSAMELDMNTSCVQATANQLATKVVGAGNILGTTGSIFSGDGVTLKSDSPCIDAGNTYVDFEPQTVGFQTLPETDLAGNPRLVDGDGDGIQDVDMGAYEYQP
jgi:predicted outer membrane repeat protein